MQATIEPDPIKPPARQPEAPKPESAIRPRKKRNSSKVNLTISFVFHGLIVAAIIFLAAREGMLGKQMKKIAVTMAPKEKPPEKPKEKPPEPKVEPPKVAKTVTAPPKVVAPQAVKMTAPPPSTAAPAAAPPAAALPAFDIGGGKMVEDTSDPIALYKGFVEYTLRSKWLRPDGIPDDKFVAEVELAIDPSGQIAGTEWKTGSGDSRWDASVRQAVAAVKSISKTPPKGFPGKFLVRFDVTTVAEESITLGAP